MEDDQDISIVVDSQECIDLYNKYKMTCATSDEDMAYAFSINNINDDNMDSIHKKLFDIYVRLQRCLDDRLYHRQKCVIRLDSGHKKYTDNLQKSLDHINIILSHINYVKEEKRIAEEEALERSRLAARRKSPPKVVSKPQSKPVKKKEKKKKITTPVVTMTYKDKLLSELKDISYNSNVPLFVDLAKPYDKRISYKQVSNFKNESESDIAKTIVNTKLFNAIPDDVSKLVYGILRMAYEYASKPNVQLFFGELILTHMLNKYMLLKDPQAKEEYKEKVLPIFYIITNSYYDSDTEDVLPGAYNVSILPVSIFVRLANVLDETDKNKFIATVDKYIQNIQKLEQSYGYQFKYLMFEDEYDVIEEPKVIKTEREKLQDKLRSLAINGDIPVYVNIVESYKDRVVGESISKFINNPDDKLQIQIDLINQFNNIDYNDDLRLYKILSELYQGNIKSVATDAMLGKSAKEMQMTLSNYAWIDILLIYMESQYSANDKNPTLKAYIKSHIIKVLENLPEQLYNRYKDALYNMNMDKISLIDINLYTVLTKIFDDNDLKNIKDNIDLIKKRLDTIRKIGKIKYGTDSILTYMENLVK